MSQVTKINLQTLWVNLIGNGCDFWSVKGRGVNCFSTLVAKKSQTQVFRLWCKKIWCDCIYWIVYTLNNNNSIYFCFPYGCKAVYWHKMSDGRASRIVHSQLLFSLQNYLKCQPMLLFIARHRNVSLRKQM